MSNLSISIPPDLRSDFNRDDNSIIDLKDAKNAITAISLVLEHDINAGHLSLSDVDREGLACGIRFIMEAMEKRLDGLSESLSHLTYLMDREGAKDEN